jgi:hypothetical protein
MYKIHYHQELLRGAGESIDSIDTPTYKESILETLSKVLDRYKRNYINSGNFHFLFEAREAPELCRGNDINKLSGFVDDWITNLFLHLKPFLTGPFNRTSPEIYKELISTLFFHFKGPRDKSSQDYVSFMESIEYVDQAEAMATFLTASFLAPESYMLCSDFIMSATAARKKWCEDSIIAEDHIWCILCVLSSVIHAECKMSLPLFPDLQNSSNLRFIVMPNFLRTILAFFKDCIRSNDKEFREKQLEKVLRYYAAHSKPQISCSFPMVKFRRTILTQRFTNLLCDKLVLDDEGWNQTSHPAKKSKTDRNTTRAETSTRLPLSDSAVFFTGEVARQPGDGHCLFHCFNYFLRKEVTVEQALMLRKSLAGYMDENRDMIMPSGASLEELIITDKDVERHAADKNGRPKFDIYLHNLQEGTKIYGGVIEIICLANMFQKIVILFHDVERNGEHFFATDDNHTYHPKDKDTNNTEIIGLVFKRSPPHYDVLENFTQRFPQTEANSNAGYSSHSKVVDETQTACTPIYDINLDSSQTKWRQLLQGGLIVEAHHLCQAEKGAEFSCFHNRDSSDFMNQKKFLPYILKKTKDSEPYEWDLLDETGLNVVEHIIENDDQGPSKEWNMWYRHPNLE